MERWNGGMVEWWNGFFSRSFCLFVCVLTIVRAKAEEYNSLHR